MSISIFDLAKGLPWNESNGEYLEVKNDSDTSWIIVEYLNNSSEHLREDKKQLCFFKKIIQRGDKQKIESYIVSELQGFTKYEEDFLAFVAGATDKSPSVLYDFSNNSFLLLHPNLISEGVHSTTHEALHNFAQLYDATDTFVLSFLLISDTLLFLQNRIQGC